MGRVGSDTGQRWRSGGQRVKEQCEVSLRKKQQGRRGLRSLPVGDHGVLGTVTYVSRRLSLASERETRDEELETS